MLYPHERYLELSKAIKVERKLRGWAKADLVRASGLSEPVIRSMQNAEPVEGRRATTYQALSRAFGKDPDWANDILANADEAEAGHVKDAPAASASGVDVMLNVARRMERVLDRFEALADRIEPPSGQSAPPAPLRPAPRKRQRPR